ncbi:hypothetical protein [Methylobacterium soli]|uniref:Uncharacterized protein n=1 Tax=Methylobacterium soli TaxID=553447 RepID=A0A6L3T851_9HYPH|nr:hypothetical protein [Methylobacterium soli]KAB1079776.1 hypothetical protein F6X53_08385 [Methylobacterium soli]GJE44583.1 hypothetical protein AEGHOMDF_3772 [Methylobacterium soli]
MSTRCDSPVRTYDPFGEPVDIARACAATPGDRRARHAALAVFWSLALLLTAGRAYLGDQPVSQLAAGAQARLALLVSPAP